MYRTLGIIFSLFLYLSCSEAKALRIQFRPEPTNTPEKVSANKTLQNIIDVTGSSKKYNKAVRDVKLMLRAQVFSDHKKYKQSEKYWFKALKIAVDYYGKEAFTGWVYSYVKAHPAKYTPKSLAKTILRLTKKGSISPYMKSANLTNITNIRRRLLKNFKDIFKALTFSDFVFYDAAFNIPNKKGIPKGDNRLVKTAKNKCNSPKSSDEKWKKWASSLDTDVQIYWKALVAQCSANAVLAMDSYEQAILKLQSKRKYVALTIEAGERLAILQRRNSRRSVVHNTYIRLMEAWNTKDLKASEVYPLQENKADTALFYHNKANDGIWTTRYLHYNGQIELAAQYADSAIALIKNTIKNQSGLDKKQKLKMLILRAEALHVLSLRIEVENGNFSKARTLALEALKTLDTQLDLPVEWIERLKWHSGFYSYLDKDYQTALKIFKQLLVETENHKMRSKLLFWLARVEGIVANNTKSDEYLQILFKEFPVSYYSVKAPAAAGLETELNWHDNFKHLDSLKDSLRSRQDYSLDQFDNNQAVSNALTKTKILVKANTGKWGVIAVKQLAKTLKKQNISIKELRNQGLYVYLSRLQYTAGYYLGAIITTTRLGKAFNDLWQKWPEQIWVYYPRPFFNDYTNSAQADNHEIELPLAITRQESAFNASARSGAAAYGLMQLIKPTAKRFLKELGLEGQDVVKLLLTPTSNIAIGSKFLKFLDSHYDGYGPSIYGAYNAGEHTMDIWKERRPSDDQTVFIELIPYSETQGYVKNVWRNVAIYNYLIKK